MLYPYRIYWKFSDTREYPAGIAFSIPKKRYRKAVDRNLIRRRSKEAYRLNKQELYSCLLEKERNIHVLFVYTAPNIEDFGIIENGMKKVLAKLQKEICSGREVK